MTRDHGGNLDAAISRYGGTQDGWIDLSTGINRSPYPLHALAPQSWTDLPRQDQIQRLLDAARKTYRVPEGADILAVSGAQAAIQMMPMIAGPGPVGIVSPTYNEHAASFRRAGLEVTPLTETGGSPAPATLVLVNPNNPDGRRWDAAHVLSLKARVDLLIIDESFMDPTPEASVIPHTGAKGIIVLRSFGKFYGLAGLRLGFAIGASADIAYLREIAGPWAVSGPAIEIGTKAIGDTAWQDRTRQRLARDTARLDAIAARAGWELVGGTSLFRTYDTTDAGAAQDHLAKAHIWSRSFPYSGTWLRLGLPAEAEWTRLEAALAPGQF